MPKQRENIDISKEKITNRKILTFLSINACGRDPSD